MKRGQVQAGSATALVTGAATGIGRRYAARLAALGYNLVLVGLRGDLLQQAQAEIAAENPAVTITAIEQDLATPTAAQELYERCHADGVQVEVLVNNAGIFSFCDLLQTPLERVRRLLTLHNLTMTQTCYLFGTDMVRRGHGYILNMSSYSIWMPFPGLALYSASKAYVRSLSVAFSKEVRESGVGVTAVCPAGVATDLYGLPAAWQRFGLRIGVLISADACARRGLRALFRRRRCIVPDWWNRIFIPLCQLLPNCVIRFARRHTLRFQK